MVKVYLVVMKKKRTEYIQFAHVGKEERAIQRMNQMKRKHFKSIGLSEDEYKKNYSWSCFWINSNISDCKHSFVEAHGIGGGYVFQYCNKCGITTNRKVLKMRRDNAYIG